MTTPPRTVRLSTVFIVASLILCLLAIAALGTMPPYGATQLMDAINSAGHFLVFGMLALLIALVAACLPFLQNRSKWLALLIGLFGAIGIGGALEVVQMWIPNRSASREDLLQDSLGAIAASCLLYLVGWIRHRDRNAPPFRWLAALLLLGTITLGAVPLTSCLMDYRDRNRAAPLLVDFRAHWTRRFLKFDDTVRIQPTGSPPAWPASAGTNVAQVQISVGERFAGWGMSEPYPRWPADAEFVMDVLLSSPEQLTLILRVHDVQHNDEYYDRFHREFALTRGYQQLRVPIEDIREGPRTREIDLDHIQGFKFFVIEPSGPIDLTVGNVRFERKANHESR